MEVSEFPNQRAPGTRRSSDEFPSPEAGFIGEVRFGQTVDGLDMNYVQYCTVMFPIISWLYNVMCIYIIIYIYTGYIPFSDAHTHRWVMEPLKKKCGDLDMKYGRSAIRKQLRVG